MTTATGSFALNFAALSDTNPYTNASLTEIGTGRGKILSAVYRWASGASSRTAQVYNGTVTGNLASKIEFGSAAGSGDAIAAIICDTSGAGYAAVCNSATSISLIRISALAQADVLGSYAPSLVAGDIVELRLNQTTHALTVHINNGSAVASATDSTVTANLKPGFMSIADNTGNATIKSFALDGSAAAGPAITSTSASPANLGRVDFYGTNFPTAQSGSAGLTIGGQAQTVTWDTSTHCYVASADPGTNALNTNLNAIITDASGTASSAYVMQLGPRSGGAVVTLSGTLASASLGLEADVPLAAGNQIEYYGAVGGTIPSDVVVNVDRTYDTADAVTGFYWRPWSSGAGWGSAAFETVDHAAVSSGDTGALFKTMMGSLFKTLLEAS